MDAASNLTDAEGLFLVAVANTVEPYDFRWLAYGAFLELVLDGPRGGGARLAVSRSNIAHNVPNMESAGEACGRQLVKLFHEAKGVSRGSVRYTIGGTMLFGG